MKREYLYVVLAALLSSLTFLPKSQSHYDIHLVIPVGLYFIVAVLLAFGQGLSWSKRLQFAGFSLLVWLLLFLLAYNALFVFLIPVSAVAGAWIVSLLCEKVLDTPVGKVLPIILAGLTGAILGIAFMPITKSFPDQWGDLTGLKAGVVAAFWQIGVGIMLIRGAHRMSESGNA